MARTFGPTRNYAPYVFLSEGDNAGEYKIFVAIPHEAGKRVDFDNNVTYSNGTTMLSFTVSNDNTVTNAGKKYKGITLAPESAAKAGGYTFYPATFSVKVDTHRNEIVGGQTVVITQSIKVFYDTADINAPATGDIANDCPYLYLTNPNAETEGGYLKYTPFCLVPLGNYEEDTQSYNENVGGNQGHCLQEIYLKAPLPSGKTEIAPADIQANTETYTDPEPIDGYFEVILYFPVPPGQAASSKHKRKGKVKNGSSDISQSNFVEII